MNISSIPGYSNSAPLQVAENGVRDQLNQLNQNTRDVVSQYAPNVSAESEASRARDGESQDRALIEQQEIANNLQANARALQAASDRIGTLLDLNA